MMFKGFILLVAAFSFVRAVEWSPDDWGDWDGYVDPTYECPALTTCVQVCVTNVTACPKEMLCGSNETLCVDGSCASECDGDLETPCEFECAPVACHNVIDNYDACLEKYTTYYEDETSCGEEESMVTLYSWTEPAFVFLYCWISAVTVLILAWCFFNQKLVPVADSTVPLEDGEIPKTQTGYKRGVVGSIVYVLTALTLLGFQILLATTCILYYVQQEAIMRWQPIFEDEEQALFAFLMTWMVGFVWTFALRWPHSIPFLFVRRCVLRQADYVKVFVPEQKREDLKRDPTYITFLKHFLGSAFDIMGGFMAFLFSDSARGKVQGSYHYCLVEVDTDGSRYFFFNFRRYNLDEETGVYAPGVLKVGTTIGELDSLRSGLSTDDALKRMHVIGPNTIRMRRPTCFRTIFKEFSRRFYTYQYFMVWSWVPLWYYYMAIVQFFVITIGGLVVSFFQYQNDKTLYSLTRISGEAKVLRDGQYVTIPQKELVPGDVVFVEHGLTYCDMVLVQSAGVLVDESAVTGESAPMAKTAIDPLDSKKAYDRFTHKKHTISAGTTVLESEATENLAVVTSTGSFTTKGELLRDILSYQRPLFKFDTEVKIVIIILALYAIFAFAMTVYFIKDSWIFGWFYGIYVVGTCLPPLLPTVFTVSVGVSEARLAARRITCVNRESILVAGKVKTAVFDKTGTLTIQGLDFISAKSSKTWNSDDSEKIPKEMAQGMATCHGLMMSKAGDLIGSSVDKSMFNATGANFSSKDGVIALSGDFGEVEILKSFDFDRHRMTQDVIVKTGDGRMIAYVKGSGESIKKICEPGSLPNDFDDMLRGSAKAGIYQISIASKEISSSVELSNISRDEIEQNLSFLGVINFKNVLRNETFATIRELQEGEISLMMITGDNVFTAICIARECGMIQPDKVVLIGSKVDGPGIITWIDESDEEVSLPSLDSLRASKVELAITGEVWNALWRSYPKEVSSLAEYIRIVGRCTPLDKVSVISALNELGHVTLMCGDGGNDCGALKTAHVGIALSDAEASIVSPFTSLDKSTFSVVEVLREGRCALASSFASYKYMILYGQVETINQMINAYFQVTFAEWCWVFMDGVWTVTLAFALPLARAAKKLSPTRPTASLLGPATMFSACGVLAIYFIFTVIALVLLFDQDWFQCRKWGSFDVSNVVTITDNYEAETLFLVTGYQYISSAIVFNFGYEWRQAWIRNFILVWLVCAYTFMQFWITLVPGELSCFWRVNCVNEDTVRSVTGFEPEPILNPFNTTVMPQDYRNKLIALMVCCTVAVVAWDYFIVNGIRRRLAAKKRAAKEMDEPSFETEGNDAMDTIDTDGSAFPKDMPEEAAKEMDEPSFETEGNDAMDTIDTDGSAFLKEMPEEYVA